MIFYFAGAGSGKAKPERVFKDASVLMTYFDFWKRKNELDKRFLKHKKRRDKKRGQGIS